MGENKNKNKDENKDKDKDEDEDENENINKNNDNSNSPIKRPIRKSLRPKRIRSKSPSPKKSLHRRHKKRKQHSPKKNNNNVTPPIVFKLVSLDNIEDNNFENKDECMHEFERSILTETDTETDTEEQLDINNVEFTNFKINNLKDMINMIESSKIRLGSTPKERKTFKKLLPSLIKLNNMIGLEELKTDIVQMILYYIQDFDDTNTAMMHTIIEGEAGVGKTEISKIIADIYRNMGFLKNKKFIVAKRDNFVAGYLGQTAIKTQKLLESCIGGVLFIDEAYSLGNNEGKDSFAKEAIDTITGFLSEHKNDFVCIIAGYKESLEKCFFSMNPGLKRRFPWKYTIKPYNHLQLREIFIKQITEQNWKIKTPIPNNLPNDFFLNHKNLFMHNGGDTENFFQKCRIKHSQRIFSEGKTQLEKKYLSKEDFSHALLLHEQNYNEKTEENLEQVKMMYL